MATGDHTGIGNKHYQRYVAWLARQPLSEQSKRAYRSRINLFLKFLGDSGKGIELVLADPAESQLVLREYKRHLKLSRRFRPSSVNATLTAIDHFYQFLGLPAAKTDREDLPQEAPRALIPTEQRRFLEVVRGRRRALDRAVPLLMINTGVIFSSQCH